MPVKRYGSSSISWIWSAMLVLPELEVPLRRMRFPMACLWRRTKRTTASALPHDEMCRRLFDRGETEALVEPDGRVHLQHAQGDRHPELFGVPKDVLDDGGSQALALVLR